MKLYQHIKENLNLSFPIMIGQLGHITVGVVDSIMIGNVSIPQLGAVSLSTSIFGFILLFCIGLSYGITPLISSKKSDDNYISMTFFNGLYLNMFFTILLVIITIYSKYFLKYLGQDEEVLFHTYKYLDIISISLVPLMLFQTFKQFIEGLGFTKPAMFISIFSNVINILLNAILIFGLFGFPRLEIVGAAYATLISRIFMFIIIFIYCFNSKRFQKYILRLNISLNYMSFKAIFSIGFTSGLQYIFEVGAFTVATVIIGSIGAIQLASHQIALNLASISYMIASGIGSASMISLGHYFGVGDKSEIRKSGYSNFILVLILMSIPAFIFIVFRDILPSFYVDDYEVISLASSLLIIAGFFQLSDGIQAVGLGILRGIRDTKIPTLVTFISYWVIAVPLSYYLGIISDYGLFGVWVGLSVGLTIAAVFHVLRFNYLTSAKMQ